MTKINPDPNYSHGTGSKGPGGTGSYYGYNSSRSGGRNFNAHVTKGGVKRGTGRNKAYTGKQAIAKVPNRYIKRLKKMKKKGQVYDAKGHIVDKPTGVLIGRDKGMYRKTDTGYKKRRFTFKQRQTFRAKKGPVFGGPKDGRPGA